LTSAIPLIAAQKRTFQDFRVGPRVQIIPIRMKIATSVRNVALIMATVRNASPAGRRVIACLARCDDWNRFWLSARVALR